MLSVNDVFYSNQEEPVRILGSSYGHSSRSQYRDGEYENSARYLHQNSRGRDGAYHNSSRYSRSSHSPPRFRRESITGLHLTERLFGSRRNRSSHSPPPSRDGGYYDHGSSYGSSYGQRNAHSPPGRYHGSHHTSYPTSSASATFATGYASSDIYHGQHTSTVPRTYQSTNFYNVYGQSVPGQTVKLKVPLCCEACEERITNHLLDLDGVQAVTCDQIKQKVIVSGTAAPSDILQASRECFKHSKFWRD
ncbi:hypothetical protein MPTK1_3g01980 [Marchantia polymorpha subsp. ruderalis]|uniref:HMA domain-containing protein n=2 Tax=Marchantia polymorpha TaxID=3197 RepID=A0AAF6AWH0_MARPO|nr:hypothetical protein MARPO_0007s0187 [Marchantia polymorpha]BBN04104.1 hypothetical protein Mp_3g01980 [Marchantia polymorpha subsp. ruderalis]|eukprot:PTQ47791.1 hypothetical protein MARPO_0007s0187 [Marchantia polymorpha]